MGSQVSTYKAVNILLFNITLDVVAIDLSMRRPLDDRFALQKQAKIPQWNPPPLNARPSSTPNTHYLQWLPPLHRRILLDISVSLSLKGETEFPLEVLPPSGIRNWSINGSDDISLPPLITRTCAWGGLQCALRPWKSDGLAYSIMRLCVTRHLGRFQITDWMIRHHVTFF